MANGGFSGKSAAVDQFAIFRGYSTNTIIKFITIVISVYARHRDFIAIDIGYFIFIKECRIFFGASLSFCYPKDFVEIIAGRLSISYVNADIVIHRALKKRSLYFFYSNGVLFSS